jgi:hypothetical protein
LSFPSVNGLPFGPDGNLRAGSVITPAIVALDHETGEIVKGSTHNDNTSIDQVRSLGFWDAIFKRCAGPSRAFRCIPNVHVEAGAHQR